jgi:hypothetical protein
MKHQKVTLDFPTKTIRITIGPPLNRRKWRASLDGETLCVSASPLVTSARILIAKGYDPSSIIELWHQHADAWALRGKLGAVAAVVLDGERKAQGPAKNGPPVRLNVPGQHVCPATSHHGGRDA